MSHGIKRNNGLSKEEQHQIDSINKQKIMEYSALKAAILSKGVDDIAQLKQILLLNPDNYHFVNLYNKLVLKQISTSKEPNYKHFKSELSFVTKLLKLNPKNYSVWFLRLSLFLKFIELNKDEEINRSLAREELGLVDKLFEFDSRNFHAWNYRINILNSVYEEKNKEKEIKVVNNLIELNFSNMSSWHYKINNVILKENKTINLEDLKEEIEELRNAMYTEPNDNTVWTVAHILFRLADLLTCETLKIKMFVKRSNSGTAIVSVFIDNNLRLETQHYKISLCINGETYSYENESGFDISDIKNTQNNILKIENVTVEAINKHKVVYEHSETKEIETSKTETYCELYLRNQDKNGRKEFDEMVKNEIEQTKELIDVENECRGAYKHLILMYSYAGYKTNELIEKLMLVDKLREGRYEALLAKTHR